MGWTIPQIRKVTAEAAAGYGITQDQAEKILSSMSKTDPDGLEKLCNLGVWISFVKEAERLQIPLNYGNQRKKTPRKGPKNAAGAAQVIEEATRAAETVQADVMPLDFSAGLPQALTDRIEAALDDYCTRYGVTDLAKDRQTRWKAACMYIGRNVFERSDFLRDTERERAQGGRQYVTERVAALVDLWAFLCLNYNKAPFIDDFCNFAGVSDMWIYGGAYGAGLTPAKRKLLKRLQDLQEAGLAGLISDGRQNPTGALAILNHWHGWTQTREVIHTDGGRAAAPAQYLTFGGSDLQQIGENGEI